MHYTKEIFDILSRGGFISQNSVSQQQSNLYDAIEDDFQQYQDYFSGYYYFSRQENKVELADKVQRMAEWIDKTDFLKTFNTAFGSGFTFRKSNILEKFSSDIELKEKARRLYTDLMTNDEKIDKLIGDLQRQGFVELQDELDGTFKVTAAFHYIEELIDCLTIIETETEQA